MHVRQSDGHQSLLVANTFNGIRISVDCIDLRAVQLKRDLAGAVKRIRVAKDFCQVSGLNGHREELFEFAQATSRIITPSSPHWEHAVNAAFEKAPVSEERNYQLLKGFLIFIHVTLLESDNSRPILRFFKSYHFISKPFYFLFVTHYDYLAQI